MREFILSPKTIVGGALAVGLALGALLGLGLPAYGQVEVRDLGYQAKAIEPLDGLSMGGAGCVPADLGSGVVVMEFEVTDVDPLADDPSDVMIDTIIVENLGTANDQDIVEVLIIDENGNCDQLGGGPATPIPGANPNIAFEADFLGLSYVIPDDQTRRFFVAVRTATTDVLKDDNQRNTLQLRVTLTFLETVGSPPTETTFTAQVTDSAPEFIWNGGVNSFSDDLYVINPLMPGETGVVARFTLCDDDSNEQALVIDGFNVKQGPDGTALDTDIASLKFYRVEGASRTLIATLTPTSSFNRGGPGDDLLGLNLFLPDDGCMTVEVEAQISPFAYKGKVVQLEIQIIAEEPVGNPIDSSAAPFIITRAPTVIGKGLIDLPDAIVLGQPATLNLNVVGFPLPGLGTLQVGPVGALRYDPTVIQIKQIKSVGIYSVEAVSIDNRRGEARFTVRIDPAQTDNALQTGTIAQIVVEAVGQPGQRTLLSLTFDQVTDADNNDVTGDVGMDPGEVRLVPPGDLDGDGRVTISDALFLANELLNGCPTLTDEQRLIADVAGDTLTGDKAPSSKIPTCTDAEADPLTGDPRFDLDGVVDLTSADVAQIAKLAIGAASASLKGARAEMPVPVQALRVSAVQAFAAKGALTVKAQGVGIQSVRVQLFDLAGRTVLDEGASGRQLRVRLLDAQGRPLANGVYLYVVEVKGVDGRVIRTDVRKLVVLR